MNARVIKGKTATMTQPFHFAGEKGYNYYHGGVDLTGFNGSYNVTEWILAHSDGTVVDVRTNCTGYEDGSYGNYVLLKHSNGYFTMYAHLAYGTIQVKYGQTVKKGAALGYMGIQEIPSDRTYIGRCEIRKAFVSILNRIWTPTFPERLNRKRIRKFHALHLMLISRLGSRL